MLTRIIILVMLLAAACTPTPVRNSAPSQEILEEATKESEEPSVATTIAPSFATEEPDKSSEVTPVPSPVVEDGFQKKLTRIAVNDLAAHLGMGAEAISVTSAESIVWPNAALGCPLPDKVYARGKVPGFRIRLKANGQVYEYHTDRTGQVILCLDPEVKPDEPGLR